MHCIWPNYGNVHGIDSIQASQTTAPLITYSRVNEEMNTFWLWATWEEGNSSAPAAHHHSLPHLQPKHSIPPHVTDSLIGFLLSWGWWECNTPPGGAVPEKEKKNNALNLFDTRHPHKFGTLTVNRINRLSVNSMLIDAIIPWGLFRWIWMFFPLTSLAIALRRRYWDNGPIFKYCL